MHSVGVGTLLGSDLDDTGGAGESLALTVDASGAYGGGISIGATWDQSQVRNVTRERRRKGMKALEQQKNVIPALRVTRSSLRGWSHCVISQVLLFELSFTSR